MPIRLLDMYAPSLGRIVEIAANRGASGIDGALASACGYAIGLEQPVALLIGDLALLHDLNSLALAAQSPYPVTIIVLNNNGGRIFEHLPIAEHSDLCGQFFVAPHGYTFEHAARMFGLSYPRRQNG
jgi:2-succinyl-5-enolpyruvyl-6-hydroxy-3-cyclohexene-1-carboxylate synthase